jgi:argininosuccinate lyase
MAKKLWGGRFGKKIDPLAEEFTKSIQYDYKLAVYDIAGSIAHVEILKKAGYVSSAEASKLINGLQSIYTSIKNGSFTLDGGSEDIHTQVQNLLEKKVGEVALKLHTARSRNDQVAFDEKLYCKMMLPELNGELAKLTRVLSALAVKHKQVIIPGFTHLQHAQPVYLKEYIGAYALMLKRDAARLDHIAASIKPSLGAGALAGTPISSSKYKGMVEVTVNSLDAVSDRDFVIETVGALSILATHLSRLAEDLIIWSTKEFGFVEIDEAFCTGSSLMPQKKNPDVLELIRGYAGRLYGNLVSVLTMMKGLPLTYNRDMQLDKEPLFNSFEIVSSEVMVLAGLLKTLKFNKAKIEEHLKDESLYATDIVYYLVDRKVPFKTAHTIVGKLVKYSLDNDIPIKDLPESLLKKFSGKFVKKEVTKLFDPLVSVRSKKSIKR